MDFIESGLRALIRRSVRRELRGVWLRGVLPPGGAVLALDHHSWWDGYVLAEVAWSFGGRPNILMDEAQLARFPFFRNLGVMGAHELRSAVRRARAGEWVWVFPEGRLSPPGPLGELRPGAAWLAKSAGVPLIPVALRVVLRGHQRPEAYLRVGKLAGDLWSDLNATLSVLDAELREENPESPLPGYLRLTRGAGSASERLDFASRMLALLAAHPLFEPGKFEGR